MKIEIEIPDTPLLATVTHEEMENIVERAMSFTQDRDDGTPIDFVGVRAKVLSSAWTERPARSFLAWLKTQVQRDDFVGDLAKDASRDPNAPSGRATKDQWRKHILAVATNSAGALEALDDAWAEFLQVQGAATSVRGV